MSTVSRTIAAPADRVWAVLADGWTYSAWIVGTSHIRAVRADWPGVGADLHHASGVWPLVVRDRTRVVAVVPGRRLVLTAGGRPWGSARVVLELTPVGDGTASRITLVERPESGPARLLPDLLTDPVLHARNVETLARLDALVRRRIAPD